MFYLIIGEIPVQSKTLFLNISEYKYVGEIRRVIYKDNKRKDAFFKIKENDPRLWQVQVNINDKDKIKMKNLTKLILRKISMAKSCTHKTKFQLSSKMIQIASASS
jgi:hypothetical protein